ncbi:tyrosine-type recombinase/integrase [Inhella sp.]|uniref:tyrosine-type recombinase/integrase n=1 Tax=Inhella sp. TaxID=1921806 RepID=UPI0035B31C3D
MPELKKVADRAKLKPNREPYWQAQASGNYLGFRKMAADSEGTWIARSRDPETGRQRLRALGAFEVLPLNERHDAAKKAAEDWFKHLGAGGTSEKVTVRDACERYVAHLQTEKGAAPAADAAARFERWVYPNKKLAATEVSKLTATQLKTWRKTLSSTRVTVNPHAAEADRQQRPRTRSSVNRDMAPLRAALNLARRSGAAPSDLAWLESLRPFERADGRRTLYLERTQRRALIDAAASDLAAFVTGLALLPLRPGALAALTVGQFDKVLGVLTVQKDKAGQDRALKLPPATVEFFREQAKDKLPSAPLLARANGAAWDKDAWKKPLKLAAAKAGLPAETSAYTLRHSVITDLVTGGLDLLTVAQISGTSIAMIERHYGQLRQDHAARALAGLAL